MADESNTPEVGSNEDTEPIDPARPVETDAPDSAQPADGVSDRPDGAGPDSWGSGAGRVAIPSWLAGALVVVLALLIGVAGFALGRATAPDDDRRFRPAVVSERGGDGRTFPLPGGGNGGGPGGLPGPGGPQGRGGDEGPRGIPGGPGERERTHPGDDDSGPDASGDDSEPDVSGDRSEVPAPPELPGT